MKIDHRTWPVDHDTLDMPGLGRPELVRRPEANMSISFMFHQSFIDQEYS